MNKEEKEEKRVGGKGKMRRKKNGKDIGDRGKY